MRHFFRSIGSVVSKLFLPLTLFFLVLILIDGAEHLYISPFIIISDITIVILVCALVFFIQEELLFDKNSMHIPRYHSYVAYGASVCIALVVVIQTSYASSVERGIIGITTLAGMVLLFNIMKRELHTYHKLVTIAFCALVLGAVLSVMSLTNGFVIFDFWNHYNYTQAFALTGSMSFSFLSYDAFYVVLGSILNIAGVDIATGQLLYGIGVILLFCFGSYILYFIGKKLKHPKYGLLAAIFFVLLPATPWGGLGFFIPNSLSLIIWPLLFLFGIQKRTWQSITLFSLVVGIIILYHPWDLALLLPIFIIWKASLHSKIHGYVLWTFGIGTFLLCAETVLYIFFPEHFFSFNSLVLPNFVGIYNDVLSGINNGPNFGQEVLFVLKNIPTIPFAVIGSIAVIVEYIKQRRRQTVTKFTEFLIAQTFVFMGLMILAVFMTYNFRIVVFVLFASIPLVSYCVYALSKKHWLLGGMVGSLLIAILMTQNMFAYNQLGQTEYSSDMERIGIVESMPKINKRGVILTDPFSSTFIQAFSKNTNVHSNSNQEYRYLDIFADPVWTEVQIEYLKTWDIQYIVVTNRTVEWARTGVAITATNEYLESLSEFVATKKQIHGKLKKVFTVVYSNEDFAVYKVGALDKIPLK